MECSKAMSEKKKPDAVKQLKNSRRKKAATPGSWKPGVSGNPHGRPRSGFALAEIWRDYLDEDAGNGVNRKRRLIEQLYRIADSKAPSIPAIRLIVETTTSPASFEEQLVALQEQVAEILASKKLEIVR
jgi:hypothetical protein